MKLSHTSLCLGNFSVIFDDKIWSLEGPQWFLCIELFPLSFESREFGNDAISHWSSFAAFHKGGKKFCVGLKLGILSLFSSPHGDFMVAICPAKNSKQ